MFQLANKFGTHIANKLLCIKSSLQPKICQCFYLREIELVFLIYAVNKHHKSSEENQWSIWRQLIAFRQHNEVEQWVKVRALLNYFRVEAFKSYSFAQDRNRMNGLEKSMGFTSLKRLSLHELYFLKYFL